MKTANDEGRAAIRAEQGLAAGFPFLYIAFMLKTIPGTYKSGVVELGESVANLPDGPVLVTFLEKSTSDSGTPSLTPGQVAELRGKLAAWEEDWNAPGMEVYDRP
jgi:hypothetical protein